MPNISNLRVFKVFSTCDYIFVQHIDEIVSENNTSFKLKFEIVKFSPGQYCESIFIETSMGIIPYSVTFNVIDHSPLHFDTIHIYQTQETVQSITLNTPATLYQSVLFDNTIFENHMVRINQFRAYLEPKKLNLGTYLTFVYIFIEDDCFIQPIFLHVIENRIQEINKNIYVSHVQDSVIETEIEVSLLNPTNNFYRIGKIQYFGAPETSYFLALSKSYLHKTDQTKICTLTVRSQDFFSSNGYFFIETESYDSYSDFAEESNIDSAPKEIVKLTVNVFTRLIPYKIDIVRNEILQVSKESVGSYSIRNLLNVPVVVTSIYLSNTFLMIHGFKPFILEPHKISEEIFVSLSNTKEYSLIPTMIKVISNATIQSSEVNFFSEKIILQRIWNMNRIQHMGVDMYDYGNVYSFIKKNNTLIIANPNYHPVKILEITVSEGLDIDYPMKFDGYTIPPHAKGLEIEYTLTFLNSSEMWNDGKIRIICDTCILDVPIRWFCNRGVLNVSFTFNHDLVFGMKLEAALDISSSFKRDLYIEEGYVVYPTNESIFTKSTIPAQQTKAGIGKYTVNLSTSNEALKPFFEVIDSNSSYYAQTRAWSNFWVPHYKFHIKFIIVLEDGMYYEHLLEYELHHTEISHHSIDFGPVHKDEVFEKKLYFSNMLATPVEYTFHPNEPSNLFSLRYPSSFIIHPGETMEFHCVFETFEVGKVNSFIPITTNATPPYAIPVSAKIEVPRVRYMDKNDNMIVNLHFIGGEDKHFMSYSWIKCIKVVSFANFSVDLSEMRITPNSFISYKINSTRLRPKEFANLCFDLKLWLFEESESIGIQFSIISGDFIYILPIYFNISDQAKLNINEAINGTMNIVSVLGVMVPLTSIVIGLICYLWFRREVKWKARRFDRAVKKYSINNYRPIEVQNDQESLIPIKTKWVYNRAPVNRVASMRSISTMEHFLG
ncbi:hypothetical protein TVAG_365920 [Trichomonas vaginalis G3]|uniref:Uncharacterized protein n=1 Tax=Trichomonas vaginalis (strain ATCC PRA-98 / G3) TaxID=412133 RepID=A2DHN6_TRIV3|nr:immunoglobulins domain-containing protein [Trichomonas vaginalis G3]EAY20084.1 hypothetical protein TVAG_365920 [Trichomonas vaginalis G3]KAI5528037.1 immunoglobulins domain-containing protein [Trichomonas vaginalis G3]|eukprot:XP_001581070.1 hypothetical protein [Trichomonas vaginalis G3]